MVIIPFHQVKIGQKIQFIGSVAGFDPEETAKRLIVYTRIEDRPAINLFGGDDWITLQYESKIDGQIREAFCEPDSDTLVQIVDEKP